MEPGNRGAALMSGIQFPLKQATVYGKPLS
jgi:hypothetical protein